MIIIINNIGLLLIITINTMKTNKLLISAVVMMALVFTACSPAQSVSGKYTGTYSGSGMSVNSGNGTLTITENGTDNINILFSSAGNSDYTASNVSVTRLSLLGITYYDLDLNVYPWSAYGTFYENTREMSYTLNNDTSIFYVSFDGTKQ